MGLGWQDRATLVTDLTASEGTWILSQVCCGVSMAWVLCLFGFIFIRRKKCGPTGRLEK